MNGFCQMHDVKNVFVVDGAAFTAASEKNPTFMTLALAWPLTDYMANEMNAFVAPSPPGQSGELVM